MVKGEIWWAKLRSPLGHEPGKNRPVLIIQSDIFNNSAIGTVICAAITTNTGLATAPGNIWLEKAESKLDKTSIVNFSQILTLNKDQLTEQVSMVSKPVMAKINRSIKVVFDLE